MYQADLPLVENVFPLSSPALAGRTNELMLLYVADPGTAPDLQRTDIRTSAARHSDCSHLTFSESLSFIGGVNLLVTECLMFFLD